jgi:hypothetical protein
VIKSNDDEKKKLLRIILWFQLSRGDVKKKWILSFKTAQRNKNKQAKLLLNNSLIIVSRKDFNKKKNFV